MPVTENPGSAAQDEANPFQWAETLALFGGLAITVITLYVFWKKGQI